MKKLRIIFMGTPDFAVPSLNALVESGFDVVAVITAPDRPKGRGQKLASSPVKEAALKHEIPILQPPNLKNPEFLNQLRSYNANLQVVVAFRMLPEVVWNMPAIGTFNLHASLLPQYRGAAPINWAIINGEKETGITTFFLKHEIDTGKIIFQEKEPIHDNDTVGTLYERLMQKGGRLVLKTVKAIESGDYPQEDQNEGEGLKKAPKIFRETCEINWEMTTKEVYNFIRGLDPYPAAWTTLNGLNLKLFDVSPLVKESNRKAGKYSTDNKSYLHFHTQDGIIDIHELQLQGKRRMNIADFFRGNKL